MELERFLILSAVLFTIGLYGVLSRRHIITILMSLEIMFNAVILAFISMSRYTMPAISRLNNSNPMEPASLLEGQIFAIFIIVAAAAEVALGLALIILFFRGRDTTDVSDMKLLRH
jgi:NADH:ubiquinone oxidoreductase subunit K